MSLQEWLKTHRHRLEASCVSIQNSDSTCLITFGHHCLEVMLPSCLVTVTKGMDDRLLDMINELNDRMSSQVGDPVVQTVLDNLLDTLDVYHSKKHKAVEDRDQDNEEYEEEYEEDLEEGDYYGDDLIEPCIINKDQGSLYSLVMDALASCSSSNSRKNLASNISDPTSFYGHCNITDPSFSGNALRLEVDFVRICQSTSHTVLQPLGIESHVIISLDFEIQAWKSCPFSKTDFNPKEVNVCQNKCINLDKEYGPGTNEYGLKVLIHTLLEIFINYCNSGKRRVSSTKIHTIDLTSLSKGMLDTLTRAVDVPNPILGMIYFMTSQVWMLPAWCPFCFSQLPSRPLKLLTCQADKCIFEFQEQGLASSALLQIQKAPKVVELELALLQLAAESHRDVLEPFPSFLLMNREYRKQNGWFGGGDKSNMQNKMITLILDVLRSMPGITELSKSCSTEGQLKKTLSASMLRSIEKGQVQVPNTVEHPDTLSYKLLSYCLSSNRTSLQLLERADKLIIFDSLNTDLVTFAVLHDMPEKECMSTKTSFFAFHGSHLGNWYSILRNGVRSMSDTRYMAVGKAYGEGIYCSHSLSVSMLYSSVGQLGELGMCYCVAILEVFHKVPLTKEFCYVIPKMHENKVALRYLLLFPRSTFNLFHNHGPVITGSVLHWADKKIDLAIHHSKLIDAARNRID